MYGGSLPIASKKRKARKSASSEDVEEGASEPQQKKAKKIKNAPQEHLVSSNMPTISEEVQDLEPVKVLNKRTRGGKSTETTQPQPAQSIPKKKRKHHARKMKESSSVIVEEEQIEAATNLCNKRGKKEESCRRSNSAKS